VNHGLLAVDPGRGSGWAWYFQGKLDRCGLVKPDRDRAWAFAVPSLPFVTHMVIERPQVYQPNRSKGDPNDLIGVAIIAGRWLQAVPAAHVSMPLPAEWKRQVPKSVDHGRALRVLSPVERAMLGGMDHNVMDAVSLGLWALGRKESR